MTQIYANYDADNDGKKTWMVVAVAAHLMRFEHRIFFKSTKNCRGAWKQSWAMETKTHLRWTPLPSFLHSCKRRLGKRQAPVLKMPNSCASVCCFVIPFASQENHSSKPQNCRGAWKQSWAMETKTHLRWTPLPSFLHFCKRQLGKRRAPVLNMPNSCASVCSSVIPFASQENHSSKPQKCRDAWKQSWAMETKTHLRWTPLPSFLHSCKRQLGKRQAPVLKMPNSCTSVYCSVIPFASQDKHSSKPQKCRDAWKQSWAMETKTHLRWTPLPSFLHSCKRQLGKR